MELPLREIVFKPGENPEFGLFAMSLVKDPAIKESSVFFNSQTKTFFSMNEEKRTVFGPALIPNQKVYRNNGKEEYNLFASRETIESIAVDFAANNRLNNVNVNHEDNLIDGVIIYQSLITNENTVPHVKGWEHLETGTLFYGAKVNNDKTWNDFKSGVYTGWSIHGYFDQQKLSLNSEDISIEDAKCILKNIFSIL